MALDYKKSAKDLAFDKERAKYSKKIKELESKLKEKDKIIKLQVECIEDHLEEIRELKDWIERLLEYTELSEEDMRKLVDKEKKSTEIIEQLSNVSQIFSRLGGTYL